MNIINWFEIPVTDLNRAVAFYTFVIEADFRQEKMTGMDMAVFHYQEPAIGGALVKSAMLQPSRDGAVVYLYTADIVASLARTVEKGGTCCFGPQKLPEDIGTIALIIDSEGNKVGLHQPA